MFHLNRRVVAAAVAIPTLFGLAAAPAVAQTYNAVCVLVDSQGNTLDLSRLCGDQSQTTRRVQPVKARPASLPVPAKGEVPDYGVIFLNSISDEPIHLGDRFNYLTTSLGNASSGSVNDIWLHYDILVSIDGEYASIGKGGKRVRQEALGVGDRMAVKLSAADVMDDVITPFQTTEDISIRVTTLAWTEADGSRNSFSPDSYRLAKGIGSCYFPWELDGAGRGCGSRSVSSRL